MAKRKTKKAALPTPTEPEYIYIKGSGWVLTVYPIISFKVANCTITVMKRRPNVGEYWWAGDCTVEQVREWILQDDYYEEGIAKGTPDDVFSVYEECNIANYAHRGDSFFTVLTFTYGQ